jgi:hypothetical protein
MSSRRASEAEVREFRAAAPGLIPGSYVQFLATTGAVEVEVPELDSMFVMLWPLRDVLQLNRDYRVADLAPGLFAVGSDGGGELLVFDLRHPPDVPIGQVPAIPLELAEHERLAGSFDELAGWLSK